MHQQQLTNLSHAERQTKHASWFAWFIALFIVMMGTHIASAQTPQNVLIVHSYSQEYDWTKRQHNGFVSALTDNPLQTPTISTEYLDTKRRQYTPEYAAEFADFLRKKYINYQPDLIYVTDDDAMQFALTQLRPLFPDAALIFSGVNDYRVLSQLDPNTMTGTFEKKDIATNLTLIKALGLPEKEIILVGDNSSTDQVIQQEALVALSQNNLVSARMVADKNFDTVLSTLQKSPEKLIILTTIGGWKDKEGHPIPVAQSVRTITNMHQFIILAMEDGYVLDGVLGGYVTSGNSQGVTAGKMAHAYLNGTAIKDMPPVLNSPNDFALDAQVLTYKHIQPSEDILQQATILNPNISFYEREKSLILGIIYVLVMIVLLGTVIAVRVLLRKNKQLNIAQQQSEAASQAKSEFLGSMSHELRTPLNAILGFSQLITLEAENNAEITDFSQEIERAGNHLLSLVNDLIDLSRIESGKLDIVFEPVLLSSLEKDCLALVAPLSEKFHVHLAIQSAEMDVVILADPVRLRQVIINFLSNGIKYNKLNGSVTLQTSIHQNIVRIQVIDTGIGIPADKQARIFSAFDRLGAECGTIEGSGIGLVITQRLIEAMGGSIGFSSVEHQGTSFWVDFPIHEQRAHTINDHNKPTPSTSIIVDDLTQQSKLPSILCIEDNPVNLKLLQKILSKKGNYQLYEAVNAIEGIHLAKSLRPNIILSDINLPDMDGYQILTLLKADPDTSHIPIVALTADAMKEDIERGEAAGFAGYVTKPIDIPTLFALIDRLLTH